MAIRPLVPTDRFDDRLAKLLCERFFECFAHLRVASVENGSELSRGFLRTLRSVGRKYADGFQKDPVEACTQHVWNNPFWEADVREAVALVGPDQVRFRSDWPHIEGMPGPLDYVYELTPFDDLARSRILRDNAPELTAFRPARADQQAAPPG